MTHPRALLPDYTAGLLDKIEHAEVEAHLATCKECREETRHYDQIFVTWVDALPEVTPTERPRERLFERLRAREAAASADAPVRAVVQDLPENTSPKRPAPGLPHPTIPDFRVTPWLAAACAALLFMSGLYGYQTERDNNGLRAQQELITRFLGSNSVQTVALYDESDVFIGNTLVAQRTAQGSSLQDRALFVLAEPPPYGRVYQAWGHVTDDWEPSSSEQLSSLQVSQRTVFEVSTAGFAALYLSLEPPGGSPQPTDPLSRVSLTSRAAENPLELLNLQDGDTLQTRSTIVRGRIDSSVRELRHRLNSGESVQTPFSNGRFMFTVTNLRVGQNRLELLVTTTQGEEVARLLTLRVDAAAP